MKCNQPSIEVQVIIIRETIKTLMLSLTSDNSYVSVFSDHQAPVTLTV